MPHVLYMFKMALEELIFSHLAVVRGDSAQMMACRQRVLYVHSTQVVDTHATGLVVATP